MFEFLLEVEVTSFFVSTLLPQAGDRRRGPEPFSRRRPLPRLSKSQLGAKSPSPKAGDWSASTWLGALSTEFAVSIDVQRRSALDNLLICFAEQFDHYNRYSKEILTEIYE